MNKIKKLINDSDAIIIGAGSGLSTSCGFDYSNDRFKKYFFDFIDKYHLEDMYSGGFYPYKTLNEYWAYFSRYIYINRYQNPPLNTYKDLYDIIKDKEYFIITTNVDHLFQKNNFNKDRLFYTQGDYGLFQCSVPCHNKTYDNKEIIIEMLINQGFIIKDSELIVTDNIKMTIDDDLIPYCPVCHKPMAMNLRADDSFIEDEGWHKAYNNYTNFLNKYKDKKILFLELGVGYNTPSIIKYPFWRMTYQNSSATYVTINKGEAYIPKEIKDRTIFINDDINNVLKELQKDA